MTRCCDRTTRNPRPSGGPISSSTRAGDPTSAPRRAPTLSFRPRPTAWLGWSLALLAALAARWLLGLEEPATLPAALLFAAAIPPAWLAWGGRPLARPGRVDVVARARWWVLLLVVPLAAGAWVGAANNRFTPWGVALWIGAVVLWLWGWGALARRSGRPTTPWRGWEMGLFVAILLAAALFRFWAIDTLPPEMTSDHAEKLLDVLDVLEGQRPIFFERNTGREPLQFYLTALLAGPLGLGLGYLALKVGTALIGWLTVPLTYAVARRGLGLPRAVALIAMALVAGSKWHVAISRVGLRFPYAPFGVALTLIFFFRALRLGERRDWLLTGAAFGVSLYGYTPVRILPLLLVAGALWWWVGERGRRAAALGDLLLGGLTALLVFLPLLRYSLEQPARFWYRSSSRALGVGGDPLGQLVENWANALLMFHVRGDEVWVNTLSGDPVLDPLTGALLVPGLAIALGVALRGRRAADGALLLALPILLLPSVLALAFPIENPSVVRSGGAIPIVMILAALPLHATLASVVGALRGRAARAGPVVAVSLGVAALIYIGVTNARLYFGPYAREYDLRSWNASEVAAAILDREATIGGVEHAYILYWAHWIDTRNVAFEMGHPHWDSVLPLGARDALLARLDPEPRLVILPRGGVDELIALRRAWPGARVTWYDSRVPGKEFLIVTRPEYAAP